MLKGTGRSASARVVFTRTVVTGKNSCIAIYPNHQLVGQALERLQYADFNLRYVSVIGASHQSEPHPTGFCRSNGRIRYRRRQSAFWDKLWDVLPGAAVFRVAGFGSVLAAGSIVASLGGDLEAVEVGSGFGVPGMALYRIGVPRDGITRYETALRAEKFLLIVHGERDVVEFACSILHSELQQVAVHCS